MPKFLLIMLFPCYAFAQEDWDEFSFDRHVRCRFPGKPVVQTSELFTTATYELPGVKFTFGKFKRDSTLEINSIDDLKTLYRTQLEIVVNTVNGVLSRSYFLTHGIITMGVVQYALPATDTRCECRLLFVRHHLYNFTICGMKESFEYEDMNKSFFNSVVVYYVTPTDQLTKVPLSIVEWTIKFIAVVALGSLVVWIALFAIVPKVVLLVKPFTIVRWTFIGSSGLMTTVMAVASIRNAVLGTGDVGLTIVLAAFFFALAAAGFNLKPAFPKRSQRLPKTGIFTKFLL